MLAPHTGRRPGDHRRLKNKFVARLAQRCAAWRTQVAVRFGEVPMVWFGVVWLICGTVWICFAVGGVGRWRRVGRSVASCSRRGGAVAGAHAWGGAARVGRGVAG